MSLEGVLNIDKPGGITSHDVVGRVRRLGKLRRVGHAGTLDPLATGVLIVCLARATRLVEYVMGQPKTYTAVIRLGQTTDTYDAEGSVMQERPYPTEIAPILAILPPFRGDIWQTPPAYSAIKQGGQPVYKRARQGEAVILQPRPVTIYALTLEAYTPPHLHLTITCSTGTYIRSLAHDIGQTLGCGGHITALRRTAVGAFSSETAVSLDTLTAENITSYLLPPETAVAHLPALHLTADETTELQYGRSIAQTAPPPAHTVSLYTPDKQFIGLAISENECWQPHKLFHLTP